MILFGLLSLVFDILTLPPSAGGFHASTTLSCSGGFLASTITELAVMLVLRTSRPFCQSHPRPGPAAVIVAITRSPCPSARCPPGPLGLPAVPAWILATLAGLTAFNVIIPRS